MRFAWFAALAMVASAGAAMAREDAVGHGRTVAAIQLTGSTQGQAPEEDASLFDWITGLFGGGETATAATDAQVVSSGSAHDTARPEPPSDAIRPAVALTRVQDSLARGETGTGTIQARLLTEMSRILRQHDPYTLPAGRTLRAAIIYLLSGGRPDDVGVVLRATPETEPLRWLLKGAAHFASGQPAEALKAFEPFDPEHLPVSIAGRVALARALSLPDGRLAERVKLLKLAARLMPGTLVEESALRRLVAIAAGLSEPQPMLATVKQYFEKFPHSVYAPDLLISYSTALAAFEAKGKAPDRLTVEVTLNLLPAERRRQAYLDIARLTMPKGLVDLTRFAATRARRLAHEDSDQWHEATLYHAAVVIVGPDYEIAADLLKRVEPQRLDPQARALLAATLRLAESIRAPNRGKPALAAEAAERGDDRSTVMAKATIALQAADDILRGLTQ